MHPNSAPFPVKSAKSISNNLLRFKEMGCCFFNQEEEEEEENAAFYCKVWALYLQTTDHFLLCDREQLLLGDLWENGLKPKSGLWEVLGSSRMSVTIVWTHDTLDVPNADKPICYWGTFMRGAQWGTATAVSPSCWPCRGVSRPNATGPSATTPQGNRQREGRHCPLQQMPRINNNLF